MNEYIRSMKRLFSTKGAILFFAIFVFWLVQTYTGFKGMFDALHPHWATAMKFVQHPVAPIVALGISLFLIRHQAVTLDRKIVKQEKSHKENLKNMESEFRERRRENVIQDQHILKLSLEPFEHVGSLVLGADLSRKITEFNQRVIVANFQLEAFLERRKGMEKWSQEEAHQFRRLCADVEGNQNTIARDITILTGEKNPLNVKPDPDCDKMKGTYTFPLKRTESEWKQFKSRVSQRDRKIKAAIALADHQFETSKDMIKNMGYAVMKQNIEKNKE